VRLSTRSRYAVRALGELVRLGGEQTPVMMRRIADGQDISKRYLDNIFGALRAAGLVRTVRGARGGYLLTRPASELTVLDVVSALDGELCLVFCVEEDASCPRKESCGCRQIWVEASRALQDALRRVSFRDIARMEIRECSEVR